MDPNPVNTDYQQANNDSSGIPPVNSPATEQVNPTPQVTKSEYSGFSLIIALMLFVTFVVFFQFFTNDLYSIFAGNYTNYTSTYNESTRKTQYTGPDNKQYQTYNDVKIAIDNFNLPYQTKRLMIGTLVNVPLMLVAIIFISLKYNKKSFFKLISFSFFAAVALNTATFLIELGQYIYKVNQQLAIYGISLLLILCFIFCIWYIQEKNHHQTM